MGFIAGGYSLTLAGSTLGQIENGIEFEWVQGGETISGDSLGDTAQDGVYRGGNLFANFTLLEYNATSALAAFWPYSGTFGRVGTMGALFSTKMAALVGTLLTALQGGSVTPTTITASKALLAPDYPVKMLFAPRLRRVPLRFQLFPYDSAGNYVHFTTT